MSGTPISHHEADGAAYLRRIAAFKKLSPALKSKVAAFAKAQATLAAGSTAAHDERDAHSDVVHAIGAADHDLIAAVDALADALVTAKLGKRVNPFKAYSEYSPSKLHELGYASQIEAANALVKAIAKEKGAPTAALKAVTVAAAALGKALLALSAPTAAMHGAIVSRDALLLPWQKALTALKKAADSEWNDIEGRYASTFAPAETVIAPVKPTKKTKAKRAAKGAATRAKKKAAKTTTTK